MCLNPQLVKLWWCQGVQQCSVSVCLKGLGIHEQNDSIDHGKLSLINAYLVAWKKTKQRPEICWVNLKCCSGLHLCLISSPRKNKKKPLSASILLTVEHEQTVYFTWYSNFSLKKIVARSNMFQGIIQYNVQKLVWIVTQVNTEVLRIKGNTH